MPDHAVDAEQYSELYVPVVRWGLKTSCLGKMFLSSYLSSGIPKLMGAALLWCNNGFT